MTAEAKTVPSPIPKTAQDEPVQYLCGDALEVLRGMPDRHVQTMITSPPYFHLRDYETARWESGDAACDHQVFSPQERSSPKDQARGIVRVLSTCDRCGAVQADRQIGLEPTPELYLDSLRAVFREAKRVLKDDGVLWLNLGDAYASDGAKRTGRNDAHRRNEWGTFSNSVTIEAHAEGQRTEIEADYNGLPAGNLLGLPWRVAFALQADGWILRQACPWVKRNAMPESVKSRPPSACEHLFMFTKSKKYFYNAKAVVKAAATSPTPKGKYVFGTVGGKVALTPGRRHQNSGQPWRPQKNLLRQGQAPNSLHVSPFQGTPDKSYLTRLRRNSDWFFESWQGMLVEENGEPLAFVVNTRPLKALHFAPFPTSLIEPCLLSSSRPGDLVLDPFGGSGTVGVAAVRHERKAVLIDLNQKFIEIAKGLVASELASSNSRSHANEPILIKAKTLEGIRQALEMSELTLWSLIATRSKPIIVSSLPCPEEPIGCQFSIDLRVDEAAKVLEALVRIKSEPGPERRFSDQSITFLASVWEDRVKRLRTVQP